MCSEHFVNSRGRKLWPDEVPTLNLPVLPTNVSQPAPCRPLVRHAGSKCGRILCTKKYTENVLISVLYPRPPPKPIEWGQNNEERAKKAYENYMRKNGHENLEVKNCTWCDFCVFTTKGCMVCRQYLDSEWVKECIPKLQSYFEEYMLPEIVHKKLKPSYY